MFDGAIEFGNEFAGLRGSGGFVLGCESGAGFARKGLEGTEGAAIARGADFRLPGAFGGGFDVGHNFFLLRWCQGGESNSRPRAYESPALPLSYPGFRQRRPVARGGAERSRNLRRWRRGGKEKAGEAGKVRGRNLKFQREAGMAMMGGWC